MLLLLAAALALPTSSLGFDACGGVDWSGLNESTPFGHHMLRWFDFEPGLINVNHGSYGAAPTVVNQCLQHWRQRAESNPDRWIRYELPPRLQLAAAELASYLNVADASDVAFVPNLSAAMGAVLNSLQLNKNDLLVYFSEAYGAVKFAIQHRAAQARAQHVEIAVSFPIDADQVLTSLNAVLSNSTAGTVKLVVVSHVSSVPTAVMPVQQITALGRKHGVVVLVDGAHAAGNIPLDLAQLQPDLYVGTCYKWLFASRGAAFIYASKPLQSNIHPAAISWNYNGGFQAEFHQQGTLDYCAFLTVPAALQFRKRLGDERIKKYNRDLASYAGRALASKWATDVLPTVAAASADPAPAMVNVRLPINDSILVHTVVERLLLAHRTFVATFVDRGRWYARFSAQVYNEPQDYVEIGQHLLQVKRLLEYPVTNAYPYCVKRP